MVRANPAGQLGTSLRPSTADCIQGRPPGEPNLQAVEVGPVLRERSATRRFCGIDNDFFGLTGSRVTMADLTHEFHRTHYPLAPARAIVDRTGLTGLYDFELRFGILPLAAIGHANPALRIVLAPLGIRNVFSALPEQLGLKLVDTTISREVLVIDHIDRP
jgi:uncharacterized protein (TIGR03435 family)